MDRFLGIVAVGLTALGLRFAGLTGTHFLREWVPTVYGVVAAIIVAATLFVCFARR